MPETIYTRLRVARVVPEGSIGATLVLDGNLPCQAGQFVMIWVPGVEERPFTLMDDSPVSLTVAAIGPLTRALCKLNVGDWVWLRGPYGHGFPSCSQRLLLLGGGSGIASLALAARRAAEDGCAVRAIIGARCAPALMLLWRMQQFCAEVIVTTDDGSQGLHGNVLQGAADHIPWATDVYACGPERMLQALALSYTPHNPPCYVNLERVMRCGIGVCGSCHCGSRLVCADGPVFPLAKVAETLIADHS